MNRTGCLALARLVSGGFRKIAGRAILASLALMIPGAPAIAQHGIYFDYHNPDPDNPRHLDHPHVDGVLLRWPWARIEPDKGRFDFAAIERDLTPWARAGKRILIGFPLAGQHGVETPEWAYGEVDAIDFVRSGKETKVRVPKYWDPCFAPLVAEMIRAQGKRFDADPRIEAVMVGIGHIGFLTAAPNQNGAAAFLEAGWTPRVWQDHADAMIRLYREAFPSKPLFIRAGPIVVRCPDPAAVGFPRSRPDFADVAEEILYEAATRHGIGVGCNGLDDDVQRFLATGIPALYERLAPGAIEGRYRLELADDWPLWVDPARRAKSPVDRRSDNERFKRCLENAIGEAPGLPRLPIGWIKLLESDLDCVDPKSADYQPDCEQKLIWLKDRLLRPIPAGSALPTKGGQP